MKASPKTILGLLSFAIRFPLGLRAEAGNFSRIQILDRTSFSLSIAGAALLLALIAGPYSLAAQNIVTGGVTGTVTDPSGGTVANATVTLKNAATGETNVAVTNDSGIYLFSFLKPGDYSLTVEQKGFRTMNSKIQVQLGQTATVNLALVL